MAAGQFVKYVATSNRKRCWNEQATIYLTAVDEVRGGATIVAVCRDFSVAPVSINTLNTSVVTKYVSLSSKERICSTCLNHFVQDCRCFGAATNLSSLNVMVNEESNIDGCIWLREAIKLHGILFR